MATHVFQKLWDERDFLRTVKIVLFNSLLSQGYLPRVCKIGCIYSFDPYDDTYCMGSVVIEFRSITEGHDIFRNIVPAVWCISKYNSNGISKLIEDEQL